MDLNHREVAEDIFQDYILSDVEAHIEVVPVNDYDFMTNTSDEDIISNSSRDQSAEVSVDVSIGYTLSIFILFFTVTMVFIVIMVITFSTHKLLRVNKKTTTQEL